MRLDKKHRPSVLIGLLVGISYSLFMAIKSMISFIEPFNKNNNSAFDWTLIFMLCLNVLMCVSFIAILRWKKWGAYLFFITTIFWVGFVTLFNNLSLTYFLVGNFLAIGVFLLILIPIWKRLD